MPNILQYLKDYTITLSWSHEIPRSTKVSISWLRPSTLPRIRGLVEGAFNVGTGMAVEVERDVDKVAGGSSVCVAAVGVVLVDVDVVEGLDDDDGDGEE